MERYIALTVYLYLKAVVSVKTLGDSLQIYTLFFANRYFVATDGF
jgi:hypothetical protein